MIPRKPFALFIAIAILLAGLAATGFSATLTQILNNGPRDRRLNLVLLSEGYISTELTTKFPADAQTILNAFFTREPWREYKSFFNAFTISVASAQSGSSHPERYPPITRDTYFHSTFYSYGIDRLLTLPPNDIDGNSVDGEGRVAALLQTYVPDYDIVLVIVNDTTYGGSGGEFAVTSLNASSPDIATHELGHSFAGLGDEYGDYTPGYAGYELPNTTEQTSRSLIKWKSWILAATPVPTPQTTTYGSVVGLFEGAQYQPTGWYRPQLNCLMRSLNQNYCAVCRETLLLGIEKSIQPQIDTASPVTTTLTITSDVTLPFAITKPAPATHPLLVQWSVDGVAVSGATRDSFSLLSPSLSNGSHTVQVLVSGTTAFVRNDPTHRMRSSRVWNLTVNRPLSAHAELSSLALSSGTLSPAFTMSGTTYTVNVLNNVTSVTVTPKPLSAAATVQVTGGTGLVAGSNTITVKVTAENKLATRTYTVVVKREGANADTVIANGNPVTFDPRANDFALPGHALLITAAGPALYGTVTLSGTSITYRPGANYAGHDSFNYTISNGAGGTATATVTISEPTIALSGTYLGVLSISGTASGSSRLSFGTNRAFSTTLYLQATEYLISGVFNAQGYCVQPIAVTGGKTLAFALRVVPGTNSLAGTVATGGTTWRAALFRTYPVYSATNRAPYTGNYTLLLPLNPTLVGQAVYPQGTGYATLAVSENGAITLAGKLGDGTPLSLSSALNNAGQFPIYKALTSGSGAYLAGVITFRNVAGVSDADGKLHWVKPAQSTAQAYQSGFATEIATVVSKYPGATALGKSGTLTLKGGTLTTPLTKSVTVPTSGGAMLVSPTGTDRTALSVNEQTGLITGSFLPAANAVSSAIYGVRFPKQNAAGGLFIQPTKTGQFRIGFK